MTNFPSTVDPFHGHFDHHLIPPPLHSHFLHQLELAPCIPQQNLASSVVLPTSILTPLPLRLQYTSYYEAFYLSIDIAR